MIKNLLRLLLLLFLTGLNVKGNNPNTDYRAKDVYFKLWTKRNFNAEVQVFNKTERPYFKNFNPKRKTILLVHGSASPDIAEYVHLYFYLLGNAFLQRGDYNIIAVDWSSIAPFKNPEHSVRNAVFVGKQMAALVNHLRKVYKGRGTYEIVAHHFGTIAAVSAAKFLKGKRFSRIMGLAPQYIGPEAKNPYKYLGKRHADVVEIIHTVPYKRKHAHRDFYPNGGNFQPQCKNDYQGICSIRKAYEYYVTDIYLNGKGYKSTRCRSYSDYLKKKCKKNAKVSFYNHASAKAKPQGSYFVKTKHFPINLIDVVSSWEKK